MESRELSAQQLSYEEGRKYERKIQRTNLRRLLKITRDMTTESIEFHKGREAAIKLILILLGSEYDNQENQRCRVESR